MRSDGARLAARSEVSTSEVSGGPRHSLSRSARCSAAVDPRRGWSAGICGRSAPRDGNARDARSCHPVVLAERWDLRRASCGGARRPGLCASPGTPCWVTAWAGRHDLVQGLQVLSGRSSVQACSNTQAGQPGIPEQFGMWTECRPGVLNTRVWCCRRSPPARQRFSPYRRSHLAPGLDKAYRPRLTSTSAKKLQHRWESARKTTICPWRTVRGNTDEVRSGCTRTEAVATYRQNAHSDLLMGMPSDAVTLEC